MFAVTTLDRNSGRRQGRTSRRISSARPTYLTVSGQLEAEIFAHAFANVYTFGPTFRAENSNTPRHLAEFYMIEPEMAFCDLDDNQDLAEAFLKSQVEQVLGRLPRRTWNSSASGTSRSCCKTLERLVDEQLRAHHLYRSRRAAAEIRPHLGVPRRLGRRPAERARALPHRGALPASP